MLISDAIITLGRRRVLRSGSREESHRSDGGGNLN